MTTLQEKKENLIAEIRVLVDEKIRMEESTAKKDYEIRIEELREKTNHISLLKEEYENELYRIQNLEDKIVVEKQREKLILSDEISLFEKNKCSLENDISVLIKRKKDLEDSLSFLDNSVSSLVLRKEELSSYIGHISKEIIELEKKKLIVVKDISDIIHQGSIQKNQIDNDRKDAEHRYNSSVLSWEKREGDLSIKEDSLLKKERKLREIRKILEDTYKTHVDIII